MKKRLVVLTFAAAAFAAPAYASTCIDTRDIASSKSTDGKTMVFKMKNGTSMVNHLQGSCPDLKFNGFAWKTHSGDNKVCENEDSFSVLQSMQVCVLGKFDAPVTEKRAAQ
jgi:hypothetical protein